MVRIDNWEIQIPFFSFWNFFHEYSRFTGQQKKGGAVSLIPHFHFHTFLKHLDISRAVSEESSLLQITSSRTQTRKLWVLRVSH